MLLTWNIYGISVFFPTMARANTAILTWIFHEMAQKWLYPCNNIIKPLICAPSVVFICFLLVVFTFFRLDGNQ